MRLSVWRRFWGALINRDKGIVILSREYMYMYLCLQGGYVLRFVLSHDRAVLSFFPS